VALILLQSIVASFLLQRNSPFPPRDALHDWGMPLDPLPLLLGCNALAVFLALCLALRLDRTTHARELHGYAVGAVTIAVLPYALLMPWGKPGADELFVDAFLQLLIIGHVFSVIPVRWLLVLSPSLCAVFAAVVAARDATTPEAAWCDVQQVASLVAVALYAAWVLEQRARRNFRLLDVVTHRVQQVTPKRSLHSGQRGLFIAQDRDVVGGDTQLCLQQRCHRFDIVDTAAQVRHGGAGVVIDADE